MDDIKKRVMVEVLTSSWTLVPSGLGLTFLLLSPFSLVFTFLGIVGVTVGGAFGLSNWLFNQEEIADRALKAIFKQEKQVLQERLHKLNRMLCATSELADERILRDLQEIYIGFMDDVREKRVIGVPEGILNQLTQLFHACLKTLEHSYALYTQSSKLSSALASKVKAKRKSMLEDVRKNVDSMFEMISELRMLSLNAGDNKKEMERIRRSIERGLNLAKDLDNLMTQEEEAASSRYQEYIQDAS